MKKLEFETDKGKFLLIDEKDITTSWAAQLKKLKAEYGIEHEFKLGTNIFKLSEIPEEQASKIVQMTWIDNNPKLCKFKNYDINGTGSFSSPIKSLHSLLKSKGVHLFENPSTFTDVMSGVLKCNYWEESELKREYEEAEQKTFYKPYIFKIKQLMYEKIRI